ncbi:MAG: hypothetical protein M3082_21670, partial [Candidatus Dormibacteraeota bacterium]|nr:hypothetical protein [Candidatus Dormibacteraeota bacterium]
MDSVELGDGCFPVLAVDGPRRSEFGGQFNPHGPATHGGTREVAVQRRERPFKVTLGGRRIGAHSECHVGTYLLRPRFDERRQFPRRQVQSIGPGPRRHLPEPN